MRQRTTMILSAALVAVLAGATPSFAAEAGTPGAPGLGDPYYPGYGNGGYDVSHYDLVTRYDAADSLTATATITATSSQELSSFNLDLYGLTVDSASVDGKTVTTSRSGSELTVNAGVGSGKQFVTVIKYHGSPKLYDMPGTGKSGWFRTKSGVVIAGEPEGAASWFPCNDHPSDKASYSFAITVPKGTVAIANGVPQGTEVGSDGWTTYRYVEDEPMAPYLATATVGDYQLTVTDHGGIPVVLASVGPPSSALARTPEVVDFLAGLFGPYPFSAMGGIAAGQVPGMTFALEVQTRPIYTGNAGDLSTVVHENAHQWFGDSVSMKQWKDIWLAEGFATYAEWMWSEKHGGTTADATFRQYYAEPASADHWSPMTADPKVADLFGSSVYTRGAMTLHALRRTVGDDVFFRILKTWAQQKKGGNATTAEFIATANSVAGKDLGSLFHAWLYTTGKPSAPPLTR